MWLPVGASLACYIALRAKEVQYDLLDSLKCNNARFCFCIELHCKKHQTKGTRICAKHETKPFGIFTKHVLAVLPSQSQDEKREWGSPRHHDMRSKKERKPNDVATLGTISVTINPSTIIVIITPSR